MDGVKAQRVRSANDPRLHDGKAFAVASVHTLAACEETGEDCEQGGVLHGFAACAVTFPPVLARDRLGRILPVVGDCPARLLHGVVFDDTSWLPMIVPFIPEQIGVPSQEKEPAVIAAVISAVLRVPFPTNTA
jgi:hypothetical protein